MDIDRMTARKVSFTSREKGLLKDFELKFNKIAKRNPKEGYANIASKKGSIVEGAIYEIEESDIRELDRFEGYPHHYSREEMKVEDEMGQSVNAIVYTAVEGKIKEGLKPTPEYLNHILNGRDIMSSNYYEKMKNIRTLS